MPPLKSDTVLNQAAEYHGIELTRPRAKELAAELGRLNDIVRHAAERLMLADEPAAYAAFLETDEE